MAARTRVPLDARLSQTTDVTVICLCRSCENKREENIWKTCAKGSGVPIFFDSPLTPSPAYTTSCAPTHFTAWMSYHSRCKAPPTKRTKATSTTFGKKPLKVCHVVVVGGGGSNHILMSCLPGGVDPTTWCRPRNRSRASGASITTFFERTSQNG